MSRVARIDVGSLDRFERTPSGGLRIPAFLTRVGVLTYRTADGRTVRELRPRDEVLSAESVASYEDAPVTDLHPPSLLDASTWKEHAVGHVRAPHVEGDRVAADLLILDADEIARIEAGERAEVSSGYTCELELQAGEHEGEAYDAIQRRIRANHAGLGPRGWGRAGPEVSLRLDAAHEVIEMTVRKIKFDGIEYDAGSDSHLQAIDRAIERKDGELAQMRRERDEARGRADALEGRAKTAETERDETQKKLDAAWSREQIDKRVEARLALVDRARRVMGTDYNGAGKSDREIMADALGKAGAKLADDASDDYVRGAFDAATAPGEEEEPDDETKTDRKDGKRTGVRLAAGGDPPLEGVSKTRADNAKWEAEGPKRFALRKD